MSRAEVGSTEEEGHRVKAKAEELTTARGGKRWGNSRGLDGEVGEFGEEGD